MITKTKRYKNTRFSAEALQEAIAVFRSEAPDAESTSRFYLTVDVGESEWKHESVQEYFADYRHSNKGSVYEEERQDYTASFRVQTIDDLTLVTIGGTDRGKIEAVFGVFEKHAPYSRLPVKPPPPPPPPTVFIGHGKDPQWRDLKDHLRDKHGFQVETYEMGARAGHAIRDILEEMLSKSSFAILVMTGEDRTSDGELRARQNVVHEAGLFQGRLGFSKAIVFLEEGVEDFSNIYGIEQIRFSRGRIKETFGDAVATLRREFPNDAP